MSLKRVSSWHSCKLATISSNNTGKADSIAKDGLLSLSEDATLWTFWYVEEVLEAERTIAIPGKGRTVFC